MRFAIALILLTMLIPNVNAAEQGSHGEMLPWEVKNQRVLSHWGRELSTPIPTSVEELVLYFIPQHLFEKFLARAKRLASLHGSRLEVPLEALQIPEMYAFREQVLRLQQGVCISFLRDSLRKEVLQIETTTEPQRSQHDLFYLLVGTIYNKIGVRGVEVLTGESPIKKDDYYTNKLLEQCIQFSGIVKNNYEGLHFHCLKALFPALRKEDQVALLNGLVRERYFLGLDENILYKWLSNLFTLGYVTPTTVVMVEEQPSSPIKKMELRAYIAQHSRKPEVREIVGVPALTLEQAGGMRGRKATIIAIVGVVATGSLGM